MKDWDTKSIKQLHSCDAGEYSVLTAYAPIYTPDNFLDENSPNYLDPEEFHYNAIFLYTFIDSGWFAKQPGRLQKNFDKLTRPYGSFSFSGHFSFSHGHFLLNSGYDS